MELDQILKPFPSSSKPKIELENLKNTFKKFKAIDVKATPNENSRKQKREPATSTLFFKEPRLESATTVTDNLIVCSR